MIPKEQKDSQVSVSLSAFGSSREKAAGKMLVKWTPN